jgi:histone demethylase JARID1
MLAEYGVDNPDDLPEHVKGKANSLRRKAANAEAAAAAAAANASSGTFPPPPAAGGFGGAPYYSRPERSPSTSGHAERRESHSSGHTRDNSINLDNGLHPGPLGVGGPQYLWKIDFFKVKTMASTFMEMQKRVRL